MTIKINGRFITVAGKRIKVSYSAGPWLGNTDQTTIKVRPWTKSRFPAEFRSAFAIENNSDAMTDYFEADCIRIVSTHPLYNQIKAAAA